MPEPTRQPRPEQSADVRAGFTFLELLMILGILAALAAVFVPKVQMLREREARTACFRNLNELGLALNRYASDNWGLYPSVNFDPAIPGYHTFTGPYAKDPFAWGGEVKPNDITASLWLLVRQSYVGSKGQSSVTRAFVCPSTNDTEEVLDDGKAQPLGPNLRSNFSAATHLSYSYASPFSKAGGYVLKDTRLADPKRFALLADRNPGQSGLDSDVTRPRAGQQPFELAWGNSRNHGRAGQNVLYADGHVEFWQSPFAGIGQDNIYTAAKLTPSTQPTPVADRAGEFGTKWAPTWISDSYLVPSN